MNVLVIHTGGTISCQSVNGVLTPSGNVAPYFKTLAKELKGYASVRFTHKKLPPILSETLNGSHLTRIAKEVKKGLENKDVDGIIVTHGSDTVAYTTAFLSYILGSDCPPTVTVCADLPLTDPKSSGHVNLRAAVALIASGQARGVFSVYRDSDSSAIIHRGSRILRHRAYESELSSTSHAYGKVLLIAPENLKTVKNPLYSESEDGIIFELPQLGKSSQIMHVSVSPGMTLQPPTRSCKAVILGTYHSGTLDTSDRQTVKFAKQCKRLGIPVYVDGIGSNADYETMTAYPELGFKRLPPLTSPVAMYIKLWILLSKGEKDLDELLYRSCGGDIPLSPVRG